MDHAQQLGEVSVRKLLLKFSVPAIVGMLVNALYNVVDRIFVGRATGAYGIAGITVSFPIMLVIMAFGMLIGMGANALISMKLGARRKKEAELVLGNAVVLLVLISAVFSVAGLAFLDPLLRLFGASPAILPYARAYTQIILAGTIFQTIAFGMNNFIRGEGNPRIAMFTMLIGAVINTALDPVFIFTFGLGIRGAALATIVAQMVSASWVLYYFLRGGSLLKIRSGNLRLRKSTVLKIVVIGSAPFSMQIVASVLNTLLNHQLLAYGGELAISAMGIIYSLLMLILMPIFGINQGVQPIIGYNYGAQKFERVKHALQIAVIAASSVTCVGFLAAQFFPEMLIGLFSKNDPMLVALGSHAMRLFLLMLPILGFQVVSANYFQAVGKPKQAMFLSLSRQLIFLIPAILLLPIFFGLDGVWMAGPVADFASSVLTGIWLFFEIRHLNDRHNQVQAPFVEVAMATHVNG